MLGWFKWDRLFYNIAILFYFVSSTISIVYVWGIFLWSMAQTFLAYFYLNLEFFLCYYFFRKILLLERCMYTVYSTLEWISNVFCYFLHCWKKEYKRVLIDWMTYFFNLERFTSLLYRCLPSCLTLVHTKIIKIQKTNITNSFNNTISTFIKHHLFCCLHFSNLGYKIWNSTIGKNSGYRPNPFVLIEIR